MGCMLVEMVAWWSGGVVEWSGVVVQGIKDRKACPCSSEQLTGLDETQEDFFQAPCLVGDGRPALVKRFLEHRIVFHSLDCAAVD